VFADNDGNLRVPKDLPPNRLVADGTLPIMDPRRLHAFIESKWKHGPCPVCQTDSWIVGSEIGEMSMSEIYATDVMAASSVYPLFPIFCTNCGYTLLFNAQIAGLAGPESESESPTSAEMPR
jgi:predicted nucleic-acid-binding Zn-ribbon protein